ncbi:hypothetical protein [Coleofasciculus sp. H7-2]|uniref:hypothetical protein n=1 Tax=Coleofasciculus sp. H7-2 TaxID=3351545 RepID=UPI00366AD987
MAHSEIHLELLLGKQVLDSTGKPVGRLEEVRAEREGDEWIVRRYLIGVPALLERLSTWTIGLAILHSLGARNLHGGYEVPWEQMDLADPQKPRLRCTLEELKTLEQSNSQ